MTLLRAENVTLIHPIRGSGRPADALRGAEGKFVRDATGRLIGVRALDRVSFDLPEGSRVGLIGRNGSGKTTLLRVLAGILAPDDGRVVAEGRATNLININLGTKDDASGHRNITLQALAHGHPRHLIEAKRGEIEEFSELGEFLALPVNTYSAGMRMRLSFAIATAFDPEILLLDEWLSAGDEAFRKKAAARMADFVDRAGILVLASHSFSLLRETCETAMWIDEGRLRAHGPVEEVLTAYRKSVS